MVDNITRDRKSFGRILGLAAVLLGQFMLVLDATVVNVALPSIRGDLGLTPGEVGAIKAFFGVVDPTQDRYCRQ